MVRRQRRIMCQLLCRTARCSCSSIATSPRWSNTRRLTCLNLRFTRTSRPSRLISCRFSTIPLFPHSPRNSPLVLRSIPSRLTSSTRLIIERKSSMKPLLTSGVQYASSLALAMQSSLCIIGTLGRISFLSACHWNHRIFITLSCAYLIRIIRICTVVFVHQPVSIPCIRISLPFFLAHLYLSSSSPSPRLASRTIVSLTNHTLP